MSHRDPSKDIAALLKRLRAEFPAAVPVLAGAPATDGLSPVAEPVEPLPEPGQPILCEFVRSMLLWESTSSKAAAALGRICESVVDLNELRVCLPNELVKIMGERYPRVEERALRLRAALNHLFVREHSLTLQQLSALGKREAKEYLDTLEGVPRYASARVMLLCLGGHHAPVDGRIHRRLMEAGVVDAACTVDAAADLLEKCIKPGEMPEFYHLVRAWTDQAPLGGSEAPQHGDEPPIRKPHKAADAAPATREPAKRRSPNAAKGPGKNAPKK